MMFFFYPFHERDLERKRARSEHRLAQGVAPWSEQMRWSRHLNIDASTFDMSEFDWFPEVRPGGPNAGLLEPDQMELSPSGEFMFCRKLLPRGTALETVYAGRSGDVMFDGDIVFPAIHQGAGGRWRGAPWMSMTPMEVFTCRGGIRAAKGDVVVAGLGLGYQLVRICQRRAVKSVTLVERSRELIDWLYPKMEPLLGGKVDDIIVGDAREVVPKLSADVAICDIDASYGYNTFPRCPDIGRTWVWGSSTR